MVVKLLNSENPYLPLSRKPPTVTKMIACSGIDQQDVRPWQIEAAPSIETIDANQMALHLDAAIYSSKSCEVDVAADKNCNLVSKIDAYLLHHISEPIYSNDLAASIGVSIRTLHSVIVRYSGLSLHRYLRHKRLLLVREQLIAGGQSIKASALAHGFWHMGDFTRAYRAQFGETPSQTVAPKRTTRAGSSAIRA